MHWSVGELSSKHKDVRAGHVRSACEVNHISGQQQEPTESNLRSAWELVGIPVL
ncbi:hypothetical protein IR150_16860 [Providencia alcalifaciens]|uniref:hypothetical protein n=1 Tax=Providencia alcalifaciens TaxID=126385 RepID=UPI0015CFB71F|nr:hypothetical protein [Providencia alcalifaciens]MBF0693146.1 hypothetical protein [Providencia alcalifaciens]NYS91650.1 hypothetical protein [Providencia alcalifaciens]